MARTRLRYIHYDESVKSKHLHHVEIPLDWCANELLTERLSEEEDEQAHYQERYREQCINELLAYVYEAAEEILTPHQKNVFALWLSGNTYDAMAGILGINYTGVAHCLMGIKKSKEEETPLYHGGIIPKLRKVIRRNHKCRFLMREVRGTFDSSEPESYETNTSDAACLY